MLIDGTIVDLFNQIKKINLKRKKELINKIEEFLVIGTLKYGCFRFNIQSMNIHEIYHTVSVIVFGKKGEEKYVVRIIINNENKIINVGSDVLWNDDEQEISSGEDKFGKPISEQKIFDTLEKIRLKL